MTNSVKCLCINDKTILYTACRSFCLPMLFQSVFV